MAKESVQHFPAVVNETPSALRLSGHDRAMAEPLPKTFPGLVREAFRLMDRATILRDALAGHFAGRTPEEIRELLIPEACAYYGVSIKRFKKGGVGLSSTADPSDATLAVLPKNEYTARYERAKKALQRLVNVIVGEDSAHTAAVEAKKAPKAPKAAKKATEATEATEGEDGGDTPDDVPEAPKVSQKAKKALAEVIATYGLTRKQALIAIAEIFANQK